MLGAGFSGFWGGVLRGILGWRRGANGRFCRGIPGVSGWARVWRGDSAHGGQYRGDWAKKFLKNFLKGVKNPKMGVQELLEGDPRAPYIGLGVSSLTVGHHPIRLL